MGGYLDCTIICIVSSMHTRRNFLCIRAVLSIPATLVRVVHTSCTKGSRARPSSAHAQATPRPGSAELDLTCGSHGSRKILPRSAAERDKAVIRSSLLHVKKYIETRHKLGALRRRPPGIRRGGVPARAATGQPALTAYVPAYMHMGRTWSEAPHLSVPGGRSQRGCPPRPRGS